MKELSVILPVYNEPNIKRNIDTVLKELSGCELIVIDDGSTDLTLNEIFKACKNRCFYTWNNKNMGKGYTFRFGVNKTSRDYILLMDSDLYISPIQVKRFFAIMEYYHADCVIGNKYHPDSFIEYSFFRKLLSKTYNLIVRKLFNIDFQDTQTGFKLFKAASLREILPTLKINRFAFDVEILTKLKKKGYKIVDAPVIVSRRNKSTSVNIKSILIMLWDTLRIKCSRE